MRAMTLPSLDYDLFMRMTSTLEELQLSHWTLSGRQFVKFLRACKRLSHLVFVAIEWTDPALVDPQYHLQAVQGLTDLQLDISVSKKDAFVDLIRSCPDLKRFSLYSESADDARTLIPVLRESCPKLMAIEYVARFSSALNGYDLLSDTEYSDLVLCSGRIESLKVDIPCLDNAMTKALITQSSTLTSLTLSFISLRSVPMIDAENICLILRHCIRLRNLSLLFNPHSLGKNETLRIFDQPWSCVELETLELTDVSMAMEHGSPSNDPQPPPLQLQPYQWRLGSAPQLIPIDGNRVIRYGSMTKQKLFQQVRMLPKLTRLSLNHITYSVDGFGSSSG
ncbi:hypothetical protein BC939DRAFT_465091 [Gamsiella multidivaricata]|uniref:uncharacterized protein n=1 Tax=Gamsiella multidivaricata TaxID=101098 RepID=UPI00221F0495|nr:uncharacterized protein BC939DRAFT_465091 [Gamsiella multidivaricata]KAI7817715.1 hypothetical protein BC939DRAFT_465091 [Gamsiella multidivaricata]